MTLTKTRTTLAALGVGLTLVLTGCGGGDSDDGSTSSAGSSVDGISAEHNDADIAFIKDMHPHHEGAIAMAELAPDKAASAEVKDLATRIAAAQDPEMTLMESMAKAWGTELAAEGGGHGGGHSSGQDGGMEDDAAALGKLSGSAFDKEFLVRMLAHHEGALTMSKTELADGKNEQARKLATDIIAAQEAEIAEMKALQAKL